MIKVVEGELIKSLDEKVNLNDLIKEVSIGYIWIFTKEGGTIREAYLFIEGGEIVGAYLNDGDREYFGDVNKVFEFYNKISDKVLIECYKYDKEKLNLMKWLYPEIFKVKKEREESKEVKKEISVESKSVENKNDVLELEEEDFNLSREELLKKLGIKEPDEEFVENLLKEMLKPTAEELVMMQEELKNKIIEKLKSNEDIEDIMADIKVLWEDGKYIVEGHVTIIPKKLFGFIKKDISIDLVRYEINNIVRDMLPDAKINVVIDVK